ncbi:hypothetical protein SLA2020_494820 [Shorea laevis]
MKKESVLADFEVDLRLARGMKTKHAAQRNFMFRNSSSRFKDSEKHGNSCYKGTGKEVAFLDPEYEMFCNSLEQSDHFDKDDEVDVSQEYVDEDMDPNYEIFLRNSREDGKSYVLEVPEELLVIKYEEEDGDFCDFENKRTPKDRRKGESGKRNLGGASEELEIMPERHCLQAPHFPTLEGNHKMLCNVEDESYLLFLKSLETNGESLALLPKAGQKRIYYKDDESSDSEVMVVDPFCDGCDNPCVPSKGYLSLLGEESFEEIKAPSQSLFREKLMDILKEPFSQSEYDDLWESFNLKRPVEGIRMLRNGRETTYKIKSRGKSYCDDYRELNDHIASARGNRHKILNLLRGFFYWLKNIPLEDQFKPWLDSSFLEACNDSISSIKLKSQISKIKRQAKQ